MARVRYVGVAGERIISAKDWKGINIDAPTMTWVKADLADQPELEVEMTDDLRAYFKRDAEFKVDETASTSETVQQPVPTDAPVVEAASKAGGRTR